MCIVDIGLYFKMADLLVQASSAFHKPNVASRSPTLLAIFHISQFVHCSEGLFKFFNTNFHAIELSKPNETKIFRINYAFG